MEFESKTELEGRRAEKRKVREQILQEAKRKYEIEERKATAAKARGEDTWMLPELSENIERQVKKLKKNKKKLKKEKKSKHDKKSKKKKKERSSSSESDESENDEKWVEKTKNGVEVVKPLNTSKVVEAPPSQSMKGPQLQRDDWMGLASADIPTVSRLELREKIKQDKLQYADQVKEQIVLNEPGRHEKELNPYWKSGAGTGLPEEEKAVQSSAPKHNLAFLQKAYARCEQLAEENGESLDSIAAERFGSLEQLEMLIMEAERAEELAKTSARESRQTKQISRSRSRDRTGKHSSRHRSLSDDRNKRDISRSSNETRSQTRRESKGRKYSRSRSRSRNNRHRSRSRSTDRNKSKHSRNRSTDRNRSWRSRSRSMERSGSRRDRSRSTEKRGSKHNKSRSNDRNRSRRSKSRSAHRNRSNRDRSRSSSGARSRRGRSKSSSRSKSPSPAKRRFLKPGEAEKSDGMKSAKRSFLKPGESSGSLVRSSQSDSSTTRPSWRKPGYEVKAKALVVPSESKSSKTQESKEVKNLPSSNSGSASGSDSGESSSDSDSENESEKPAVVALTDDEMNTLGAKILKAEIMGNEEVASELKQKLELARKAREAGVKPASTTEKEKIVVLSHTDKFGNVRPVKSHDPDIAKGGGKRRRAKKMETHDKSGQRERYFADDDRFNIKDMVQAEKMTSAEDQHLMFSQMAAKVTEKIDDDNQIDDAMINRARLEHDPTKVAAKQQNQAMADSKRLAQTLDNCSYCLDNMTKHLIIAVSQNTYLCLPEHQSLTEGHCKIIPIHHTISSTVCDENVWDEVQEYRKALVKMFSDNDDQDCVFMECSKNLKRHPHMVIDCVPMARELGDMAPIYFKKAIQESEKEWSQNKKLVDLSTKDIRHSIPKGFPYFAVDFGLQGGFAHVIEDEYTFQGYFGKEVVGGMMDVEPQLWRKPRKENFEDQRKKVINFAKMWKPYNFTNKKTESDSH